MRTVTSSSDAGRRNLNEALVSFIETQVVGPQNTKVLGATAEDSLTLVTCYPFYFVGPAPQRFIVRAHRVSIRTDISK